MDTMQQEDFNKVKRQCRRENYGTAKRELENEKKCKNYHASKLSPIHKVQKFKQSIEQELCYICVSCNRCHYIKSVVQFKQEKYNLQDDVFTDIVSFDLIGKIIFAIPAIKS